MKYKIAIFDMDGTILNTLDDLADSMNHCLRARGLAERSLQEIRTFLGNGIHRLVNARCRMERTPKLWKKCIRIF